MRDYLRRTADDIWVIDCSPEGHQPEVATRIFQGVQQPVCIVLVSRSPDADPKRRPVSASARCPPGAGEEKFDALAAVTLDGDGWADCPSEWRAPSCRSPSERGRPTPHSTTFSSTTAPA